MKDSKKQTPSAAQNRPEAHDGAVEHMPRLTDAKKAGVVSKGSPDGLPRRSMFRDRLPGEAE